MKLIRRIMLVTSFTIIAATLDTPTENGNSHCGNSLVQCFTDEVFAKLKPKIVRLEEKLQNMEHALNLHREQIQVLQNRKDLRCESGNVGQHTNPPPTWPYTQSITFQSPFEQAPTLTYGLYLLDSAWNTNLRVNTDVSNVTKTGFQIKMYSWADTQLYGARASWMACGK